MSKSMIGNPYKQIGENDFNQSVKYHLGTGFLPLNYILSGKYDGGFPVGRITEVYGGESSGKTLLATMTMIEAQRRGGFAVFFDYEYAFDVERAQWLGLSVERGKWFYRQPTTAEEGFGYIKILAETIRGEHPDKFICIIEDSIASMTTLKEGFKETV